MVVGFLFMMVAEFFVYYDGWVFYLWQWLSFCVGGYVFCLMMVAVFFVL